MRIISELYSLHSHVQSYYAFVLDTTRMEMLDHKF